jgi:hypothetical protein
MAKKNGTVRLKTYTIIIGDESLINRYKGATGEMHTRLIKARRILLINEVLLMSEGVPLRYIVSIIIPK